MSGAVLAAAAAVGIGAVPGGGSPAGPPAADSLVLRDDLGREVRLAAPPRRIVSLVPAFTEIVFALGAGDRLVGRTRYGVHPPEARDVPSVGQGVRPSIEAVVAREPELVLLFAGAENRSTADRFADLGVPALALEHNGVDDLFDNLELLGRLTGRRGAAGRLARRLRCRLGAVARVTSRAEPRRVYYEVWGDPPVTVGAGSYLDSLVAVAGGVNVFGELEAPSPRVSLEAISARRPEVVIVPRREGGGASPPLRERPGWGALEAVRLGRVRQIDGDLVHRLGPRLGEAAAELAAALHPELEGRVREALRTACPAHGGGDGGPTRGRPSPPGGDAGGPAGGPGAGARGSGVPAGARAG